MIFNAAANIATSPSLATDKTLSPKVTPPIRVRVRARFRVRTLSLKMTPALSRSDSGRNLPKAYLAYMKSFLASRLASG